MKPQELVLKILREKGLLTREPEGSLLARTNEGPIRLLAREGYVAEKIAIDALCTYLRLSYIDLDNEELQKRLECKEFVETTIATLCWNARLIPLYHEGSAILIAMANPCDIDAVKSLEFTLGKPIRIVVAEELKIHRLLTQHFPQKQFDPNAPYDEEEEVEVLSANIDADYGSENASADPPIIRLANKILADAVDLGASDIHMEPGQKTMLVRFRIDGVLQDIIAVPQRLQSHVVTRLKVLAKMNVSEKRKPQDGRMRISVAKKDIDLRVSSIPTAYGEKLVLRVLGGGIVNGDLSTLGMPKLIEDRVRDGLHKKGRLFLVSGPTGSGKTTTLYVGLNFLNDGKNNITTIEDPVEYRFRGINQIQVNEPAGVTFASALRSLLRQDPDVIMVGEIRDEETLKVSLQAAQTGHLVLSTVHTNDALATIARLSQLGGDPHLFGHSLIGVLAQRLVRRICQHCPTNLSDEDLSNLAYYIEQNKLDPRKLLKGKGCERCAFTGYKGRVGVYSHLHISPEVAETIARNGSPEQLLRVARRSGFTTIQEAALDLVVAGATTLAETQPYLAGVDSFVDSSEMEIATDHPTTTASSSTPQEIFHYVTQVSGQSLPASSSQAVPVNRAPSAETTPIQHILPPSTETTKAPPRKRPRVLIVDDSLGIRRMLTTLLRKEYVEIEEAANGMEGLRLALESLPDLILCDLSMPEMTGEETLKRLKRHKSTRDIPVIMLTIDDSEQNELGLLELGATSFLSKRLSPIVLVSRIKSVLDTL